MLCHHGAGASDQKAGWINYFAPYRINHIVLRPQCHYLSNGQQLTERLLYYIRKAQWRETAVGLKRLCSQPVIPGLCQSGSALNFSAIQLESVKMDRS